MLPFGARTGNRNRNRNSDTAGAAAGRCGYLATQSDEPPASSRGAGLGRKKGMSVFVTGFVIFSNITQLDFTGPFEVLSQLGTPPPIVVPRPFPMREPMSPPSTSFAIRAVASSMDLRMRRCRHSWCGRVAAGARPRPH